MVTIEKQPMVSVAMLVYNHEKYIREALESVLNQEVNFTYEIVVGEDCSTDNSRAIIEEYVEKYPDIIKPIFHEQNVGVHRNSNIVRHACIGKYRATLEGDDYWYSRDKLQKQVDFLENNPDFIAIGGDFICIDDDGDPCPFPWGDIKYTYCQDEEYTFEHLQKWLLPAHASAMLFRNVFHTCSEEELADFESRKILGDRRTSMYLVLQGRVKHTKEIYMVRRVLTKSSSSMTSATRKLNWHGANYGWLIEAEKFAKETFGRDLDLTYYKELRWGSALKLLYHNPSMQNLAVVREIYKKCGDKKHYRKFAKEKFKMQIQTERQIIGRYRVTKKIIKMPFKVLIHMLRSVGEEKDYKSMSIMKSFS